MSSTILYYSAQPYSGLYQRFHHLLAGLSKHDFKVAWAERQIHSSGSIIQISNNFTIYPTLNSAAHAVRDDDIIYYTHYPAGMNSLKYFSNSILWYDFLDDVIEWKNEVPIFFQKADIITCSSNILYDIALQKTRDKNKVLYAENGVDYNFFSTTKNKKNEACDFLQKIRKPIIMYSGCVAEWFDFELFNKLTDIFPDVSFVVVGFYHTKKIAQRRNVFFLGQHEYNKLADIYSCADIAVIPFLIDDMTHAVDPLKMHEFNACGKPVVSSAFTELSRIGADKINYVCDSEEKWINTLKILIEHSEKNDIIKERHAFAKKRDWSNIVAKVEEKLKKEIAKKWKKS